MSPMVGRIESELLNPLIMAIYQTLIKYNRVLILEGANSPPEIEIEYVSPLSRAQKTSAISSVEKAKIVIEAIKGELTIAQITSKYGVHATQISNWKKQGLELLVQGFKNKTQSADPNQQTRHQFCTCFLT